MGTKIQTRKLARPGRTATVAVRTMREDVRAFKREIILNAATDVFYNTSYQNSSVDDIATAMSVTKAVVYYNFTSKEEVLEQIIDRSIALTHESIDHGIAAGRTPAQKLALLCFFYAFHILKNQKMVAVYFREERNFSAALRRRTTMLEKSVDEKVSTILNVGIVSGEFRRCDTRLMAITIMGMISMGFHWYREGGRLSAEALSRHFSNQALRLAGYSGELGLDDAAFKLTDREAQRL
jgi:AcrR family transcriptional regulator